MSAIRKPTVLLLLVALFGALASIAAPTAGAQPPVQRVKPMLSIEDASTIESAGRITFTAKLDQATTRNVNFRVRVGSGNAKAGTDHFRTPRRIYTVPKGTTSAEFSLRVFDDNRAERNEYFSIMAGRVWNGYSDGIKAIGIIYDDELTTKDSAFDLNILHINDHHSHLQQDDITLDIAGGEVDFELGGFGRVAAQIKALEEELKDEPVAKIHAGDAITGTLFYSLFKGEADAAVMNEVCFDLFALGNHEFDDSDAGLRDFLDFLAAGDCDTEVLAANIRPEIGTPLAPVEQDDYITPYTVRDYDGTRVGFVGIDIAQKTKVSSSPLDTTEFGDELFVAQTVIDRLSAVGVNNIVLVTHYQYANDLQLANDLRGVDVIIGGDSHSLLGDFDNYGLSSAGDYPTLTTDNVGNTVCVAQAWQYSYVVGNIAIGFDKFGRVTGCSGTPHLLLGSELNADGDPIATTNAAVTAAIAADDQLTVIAPDPATEAIIGTFDGQVADLQKEVIGTATAPLCVSREPNEGRSTICSDTETPNGGQIQQLVTDAFLARAFRATIALQNSGGVRIDIDEGDITVADAYELLPFANTLFEVEMTGAEVQTALEQGVGNWLDAGGSNGAFPYGAGIRWDLDITQAAGSRFSNVEVQPKGTTGWIAIDPTQTYVVVANSFMASGGDGYQVIADAVADGRGTDTFLDYAQSFIDYVEQDANGVISPPTEFSLQNYTE